MLQVEAVPTPEDTSVVAPNVVPVVIAVAVVSLVVVWRLGKGWLRRNYKVYFRDLPYAARLPVTLEDGLVGDLYRVGEAKPGVVPVLLLHGLGMDHRNVDMLEDASLGRYLEAHGRSVWLFTMRSGALPRPRAATVRMEQLTRDVKLAIDHLLTETGANCIDVVGFSMGGTTLANVLGDSNVRARVRRVAFIGSPMKMTFAWWQTALRYLVGWIPLWIEARGSVLFFLPWVGRVKLHRVGFYFSHHHTSAEEARAVAAMLRDIPLRLLADLHDVLKSGSVLPVLSESSQPLPALFVAGLADQLVPPDAVRYGAEHWPFGPAELVTCPRRGHGDLMFGREVAEAVFSPVQKFLGPGD